MENKNFRFVRFLKDPPTIKYLAKLPDGNYIESSKQFDLNLEEDSKIQVIDALDDLVKYLLRVGYLILTDQPNVFEITGILTSVDKSIKTLTSQETEFLKQYSLLAYILWSYQMMDEKYGTR